jgi:hypothetical protein
MRVITAAGIASAFGRVWRAFGRVWPVRSVTHRIRLTALTWHGLHWTTRS